MSVSIAGIHTGIGKTICSAIICQALGYDYFKPIQAGDLDNSDSICVRNLINNPLCVIHPEIYKLKTAASPHYAAKLDGVEIIKNTIFLPPTPNNIVVETAGGIMSPLANNFLNIDLIAHLNLPTVLVSNNYLGSINHTLMSYEILRSKNLKIVGIVFNGEANKASESYILQYTQLPVLFTIPQFEKMNAKIINEFAKSISIDFLENE